MDVSVNRQWLYFIHPSQKLNDLHHQHKIQHKNYFWYHISGEEYVPMIQ
jgi:hypothetical protein